MFVQKDSLNISEVTLAHIVPTLQSVPWITKQLAYMAGN